ncbi:MAG: hypothetical protein JXA15_08190 [Spirochaetales bacterium]|nr:hypothetical protein [Spirochaetales bacterium]
MKGNSVSVAVLAAVFVVGTFQLAAQSGAPEFGGVFSRSDAALYVAAGEVDSGDFSWTAASALELALRAGGDSARAEAAFTATVLNGSAAEAMIALATSMSLPSGSPFASGGALVVPLASDPASVLLLELRSLQLRLDLGEARLRAGRQVVNFGRGQAFSPADVFARRDLSGLSPARAPVDALRLSGPFGQFGGWDLVAAPRAEAEDGTYAARAWAWAFGVDGGLIAGRDGGRGDWLAAADVQFDLGATFRGEVLLRYSDSGDARVSAMAGLDWSLGDLLMGAEYYRNGDGAAGAVPLSGAPGAASEHYLFATLGWQAGDFASLSASALAELDEGLWAPALALTVDATQSADLVVALRGLADSGGVVSAALAATLELSF